MNQVGVRQLAESWCINHDAVWFEDEGKCDFADSYGMDECDRRPLYVGVDDGEVAA